MSELLTLLGASGGGGGVPVGGLISAPINPIQFTDGSTEYLQTGSVVTYSTAYDTALATASKLAVFGSDAKQYGTTAGTSFNWYTYVGTNYVVNASGGTNTKYSSNLSSWSEVTYTNAMAGIRPAVGNGYVVLPASGANLAPQYSTNGSAFSSVGGTFATCPVKTAICYAPSVGWLALSSLIATAGEQTYIANVNPTGSWTVGAGTSVGTASVAAIAYGGGKFVAVGSSVAVYGKIATCTTLGGTWTDQTAGATFITQSGHNGLDVVYTGTHFVATFGAGFIARSSDGVTWTKISLPSNNLQPPNYLATDGSGKVIATPAATSGAGVYPIFWLSTDHGATWKVHQMYVGKIAAQASYCTPSYANGKFIINHAGNLNAPQDLGSLTTPDYVGMQKAVSDANASQYQHVRIK